MDLSIYLRYYSAAGIYFSFRWGPFVHSLEIVQWDSTRRDHPGYPGRVCVSGPVINCKYLLKGGNRFQPFPIWDDSSVYRRLNMVNITDIEEIELYI